MFRYVMETVMACRMPAKCMECEAVFDLSYDMDRTGDGVDGEETTGDSECLCWVCRDR